VSIFFAGMVSLVNAGRIKAGKGPVGYLNPAIYKYADKFARDVTEGDNHCVAGDCSICCVQGFIATKGWDPVTGFGTIDFPSFYDLFVNIEAVGAISDPGPEVGDVLGVVLPIIMVLILASAAYVAYAFYLNPKDDQYTPLTDPPEQTERPQA
jgi:hypothetical protein